MWLELANPSKVIPGVNDNRIMSGGGHHDYAAEGDVARRNDCRAKLRRFSLLVFSSAYGILLPDLASLAWT